jgi:SAM-dependent methyltransferase
MSAASQRYWDDHAAAYAFGHPVEWSWLAQLPKDARILDYGCGYGRLAAELADAGWRQVVGVDFAAAMIERGRREHPALDLRHVTGLPLAAPDGAFDAALLFAVLTSIPDSGEQEALMAEVRRLIRPGGLLYLSDLPLQTDQRHASRYAAGFARHGVYGVFDRQDGGVFRHHPRERLDALMEGFDLVAEREIEVRSLSGVPMTAIQRLGRRVGDT